MRSFSQKASSAISGLAPCWTHLASYYTLRRSLLGQLLRLPSPDFFSRHKVTIIRQKILKLLFVTGRGWRSPEGIFLKAKPQNCKVLEPSAKKGNYFPRFQYHWKMKAWLIYLQMLPWATPKGTRTLGIYQLLLRQVIWLLNHWPTIPYAGNCLNTLDKKSEQYQSIKKKIKERSVKQNETKQNKTNHHIKIEHT